MFDIGWTEMVLIIVVMIIVIGPKELPRVLHTMGQWIGRVRRVARQFQDSIEQMAHESGVDELRKEIENVSSMGIEDQVAKTIDPKGELEGAFDVNPASAEKKQKPRDTDKIEAKADTPADTDTPAPAKERQ